MIFVPKGRQYPTGFNATVTGRDRFEWNEKESVLLVFRDPNQRDHTVSIARKSAK